MPLAYNEKTGEVVIYWERKFISKEKAAKIFPNKPKRRKQRKLEKKDG